MSKILALVILGEILASACGDNLYGVPETYDEACGVLATPWCESAIACGAIFDSVDECEQNFFKLCCALDGECSTPYDADMSVRGWNSCIANHGSLECNPSLLDFDESCLPRRWRFTVRNACQDIAAAYCERAKECTPDLDVSACVTTEASRCCSGVDCSAGLAGDGVIRPCLDDLTTLSCDAIIVGAMPRSCSEW